MFIHAYDASGGLKQPQLEEGAGFNTSKMGLCFPSDFMFTLVAPPFSMGT